MVGFLFHLPGPGNVISHRWGGQEGAVAFGCRQQCGGLEEVGFCSRHEASTQGWRGRGSMQNSSGTSYLLALYLDLLASRGSLLGLLQSSASGLVV